MTTVLLPVPEAIGGAPSPGLIGFETFRLRAWLGSVEVQGLQWF